MAQLGKGETDADGTALTGIEYRKIGTLGHMKVEVVNCTDPQAEDYFYTELQNPIGLLARATSDGGGNTDTALVSLSGKTVTFSASHNLNGPVATLAVGIIIFGV